MVKIDFVNAQEPAINDTNLNQMQLNIENAINAQVSGDTLPVGCIVPFTSDTVPENWLLCDGSAISRTDYALLFSIIGTTYGQGDGSTTFNLPNLKGRVAVGKDSTQTEFDTLGETGGEKTHTLTVEEMPSHNHMQSTNYGRMTNMLEIDSNYGFAQSGDYKDRTVAATNATTNVYGTSSTGGGQPHNILQPYQVTNYIIKARQSSGLVATVVDGLNSTSTTDALSANQGRILNQSRIVDIVSNSDGTAYKYENGLMMCSMRYIVNSTVDGQWGYSYISSPKTAKNYPVAFISNPVYQINIEPTGRDGAWIMNDGVASGTKPSNFYLVRGDNLTNAQDFIINVFAIGNWK